jgi:putative spermidine/putrescine transport system permease protein
MSDAGPRARLRRITVVGLAAVYAAPFMALVVRAAADSWRYPAIVPQHLGTRGMDYLLSTSGGAWPALRNSLLVAFVTTAAAVVLAWPASRVLARGTPPVRAALLMLLALPLLVPPLAVGHGLSTWLLRWGLADSLIGLVAAHLVYVLPYVALLLAVGFTGRVTRLEEAAATLGATHIGRLRYVTLPAVAPALTFATLLGFVVSWSQYGTSLAVAGGTPLLPLVLIPFTHTDPQIASTLALLFLGPPLLALAAAARWGRHR